MPGWIEKLILRILGTEPIIKIMYSIVIFFLIMIFSPQAIYDQIQERTSLQWAWGPIFYAIAFVLTDALQRVITATWSMAKELLRVLLLNYLDKKNDESTAQAFLRLSKMEKSVIRIFLQNNSQTAQFSFGDIAIVKLKRKGLIVKKEAHHENNEGQATEEYFIPDDKWEVLLLVKHHFGF
ncbi:super-infection exclusion protein B [Citrobacter koseri]|uniref:super-infection exclusion protein B n=1 Tax=Citrobacter koseri TaxID=545 RepID=UPI0024B83B81|nr:super-infection exclusion protein B [Citrobacter koseri]MDI9801736.1 super-infection exclusion protein B [Citrobacter koseri]